MDHPTPPPPPPSPEDSNPSGPGRRERPAVPPDPAEYAAMRAPDEGRSLSARPAPAARRAPGAGAGGGKRGGSPGRVVRDPGGPRSGAAAWILLIVLLAVTVAVQWGAFGEHTPGSPAPVVEVSEDVPAPGGLMQLLGRYGVGADRLAPGSGKEVLNQLRTVAATPADSLRLATVAGEVQGADAAVNRLGAMLTERDSLLFGVESLEEDATPVEDEAPAEELEDEPFLPGDGLAVVAEAAPWPQWLEADHALLMRLYTVGVEALTEEERAGLIERHGWFGELALSFERPDTDPLRAEVLGDAAKAVGVIIAGVAGAGLAFVVGCVLAIVAIVMRTRGGLAPRYVAPAPGGSVYLETFALFIVGFLAVGVVASAIQAAWGVDTSRVLVWLLLLAALWPLARGAQHATVRFALGWHRGSGVVREIGAGVLGYLAGLPIFACGVLATLALAMLMQMITGEEGAPPSHPILEEIGAGGVWGVVGLYMLAAVWAPVVEETFFRGALYHHFRGRLGFVAASLAVALVFAIIHPQGIIAVPALMSLAVVFSLIREWRGSLIGAMTAHALHNGTLVTLLLLAMS